MFIPTELLETKRIYDEESQEYDKFMDQIWLYKRWAKRINKQIPKLAMRIFELRNKSYTGYGFNYSMERTLGNLMAQLNNYDDVPDKPYKIKLHRITMNVITRQLFKSVVEAEQFIALAAWARQRG